ncbi:MAG: DUF262 domain-containing protein [Marinifilaceae bacterium]|jgi:hypothetical protein|nr:DUF262 domain-containing protein [Marinifilaceae bacterium]
MEKTHFKLEELLDEVNGKKISLPTVQRGFVWKPSQIEDLWDSLLRQYPIGAFVVSEKNETTLELLDGQQRATSICLGLCSDKSKTEILKSSLDKIRIFIDLGKPNDDKYKYIFRVITKSHPWGYQRSNNTKKLNSKDIRTFLSHFDVEKFEYLTKELDDFYPYDAIKPVPFYVFMKESLEECKKAYEDWKEQVNFKQIISKNTKEENSEEYTIEEIYNAVQIMKENQKIPLLDLNFNAIIDSNENELIESEKEDSKKDEIENLFVRLNSSGTPISGEELNYSILKSNISNEIQEKIEKACEGFIKPSRLITILYKLYEIEKNGNKSKSSTVGIKPKQFQKEIKNNKTFEPFINKFIDTDYLGKLKKILLFDPDNNEIGLSQYIISDLTKNSLEIMFILMYRMYIQKDFDDLDDSSIHEHEILPRILGVVTIFLWLGKGKHKKILSNIFTCLLEFNKDRFWSSEVIERAMICDENENRALFDIPERSFFDDDLKFNEGEGKLKESVFKDILKKKKKYYSFFSKLLNCKGLLFHVQRDVIYEWFKDLELKDLDDTNVPFDLDHISPKNYISNRGKNKRKINKSLLDIYNTIGNYRAWPYELNRSDSDDSPSKKFNDKNNLDDSYCHENWSKIDSKKSNPKFYKNIEDCIIFRFIDIIKEWYDSLEINELIPEEVKSEDLLENVIKINDANWNICKHDDSQIEYKLKTQNKDQFLYIAYHKYQYLEEGSFEFGLLSASPIEFNLSKISHISEIEYNDSTYFYLGYFTLQTSSDDSIETLLNELRDWIKSISNDDNFKKLLEVFNKSLKQGFKVSE